MYSETKLALPKSLAALSSAEPAPGSEAYRMALADFIEDNLDDARLGDGLHFGPSDLEVILDALRQTERPRVQQGSADA